MTARGVALILAGGCMALLGASLLIAQPRTSPPVEPTIVNMIFDFGQSHPDWAVLRGDREDAATVKFNHARHMDAGNANVQEALQAHGQQARAIERLADGQLSLTCASCHQPDAQGRYMKPISFEQHCVACHEQNLIQIGPRRAVHGNVSELIEQVNRELLASVLKENLLHPPDKAVEELEIDIDGEISRDRHKEFDRVLNGCGKCHYSAAIERPKRPRGAPFELASPAIPQRWLERSVFSHEAHRALTCLECHAQATTGTETSDIMLPSIDSCRACHAPEVGVRSDCVLCHVYHPPLEPAPTGTLTIEEYAAAGGDAPDATTGAATSSADQSRR